MLFAVSASLVLFQLIAAAVLESSYYWHRCAALESYFPPWGFFLSLVVLLYGCGVLTRLVSCSVVWGFGLGVFKVIFGVVFRDCGICLCSSSVVMLVFRKSRSRLSIIVAVKFCTWVEPSRFLDSIELDVGAGRCDERRWVHTPTVQKAHTLL